MLTGLGGHSFAQCIDNIYAIQDMFAPEFPQNALEDWTPSRSGEFDAVTSLIDTLPADMT